MRITIELTEQEASAVDVQAIGHVWASEEQRNLVAMAGWLKLHKAIRVAKQRVLVVQERAART